MNLSGFNMFGMAGIFNAGQDGGYVTNNGKMTRGELTINLIHIIIGDRFSYFKRKLTIPSDILIGG